MQNDKTKLKLSNIKVIFESIKDQGFGRSLTVDVTDSASQILVEEWVKENHIGKGDNAGKPNFKEYQPEEGDKVIQYAFKINDYTKFIGVGGLTIDDLGYGAEVSLVAQAFQYDNKFGKGTSASLTAVLITKAVRTSADDDIDDLLSGAGVNPEEVKTAEPNSGYEAAKATAEKLKTTPKEEPKAQKAVEWNNDDPDFEDSEISLEDIPF